MVGHRLPPQEGEQLAQGGDPDGVDVGEQACLGEVGARHHDASHPRGPGDQHGRQHPADPADLAVQAQLAEQDPVLERGGGDDTGRGEDRGGQREVEAAAALGQRGRRQAQRDALRRPLLRRC